LEKVVDPETGKRSPATMADVWGLGILLYEFVVGRAPFEGSSTVSTYKKIRSSTPVFPDHVSPECKDLICKMLRKKPSERISLEEVREIIQGIQ
jgi:aurora kinase, other